MDRRELEEAIAVVGDDVSSVRIRNLLAELIDLLRARLAGLDQVVLGRLMFSVWCP